MSAVNRTPPEIKAALMDTIAVVAVSFAFAGELLSRVFHEMGEEQRTEKLK